MHCSEYVVNMQKHFLNNQMQLESTEKEATLP